MAPGQSHLRRLRFLILEKVFLPLAVVPFRLLVWSWRKQGPADAIVQEIAQQPRVILAIRHGTIAQYLAFTRLWVPYRRSLVILLSPSLDGKLLAAALKLLGVDAVRHHSGGRRLDAAFEFIRRVQAGDIGVLAIDGPRGPRDVVNAGVVRTAAAADARIVVATTSATWGYTFGSWDRAHLPAPFARVEGNCQLLRPLPEGTTYTRDEIQQAFGRALQPAAGD
jgi:lysophospholipid acyltransferase (LPLAT)-like uncharacterized protein